MTHFRKHSKAFVAFMCILTLVLQLSFAVPAMAATAELDVIFVLDDSGSMANNDPDGLSTIAISKFADAVTNQDVWYGVAVYGDVVTAKLPLGATKDEVKAFVGDESNVTKNQAYTNAAAGIKWAMDELRANGRKDSSKAIILIGDGKNDLYNNGYTGRSRQEADELEKKSEEDKEATITASEGDANTPDDNIPIYAIAVSQSTEPNFQDYFADIAKRTGGTCATPKTFDEVDQVMTGLLETITGGDTDTTTFVDSADIDVNNAVYQLVVQCDYTDPVDIAITSPSGIYYDKNTKDANFSYTDDTANTYIQIVITDPEAGTWKIEAVSNVSKQTIEAKIIQYGKMGVILKPTTTEDVIEGNTSRYVAEISTDGKTVTEESALMGFEPKLAVVKLDKDGNRGNAEYTAMTVENGHLSAEPEFKKAGNYVLYVELKGDSSTITSNELTLEVLPDPNKLPWWVFLLIGLGVLLLVVGAVIGFNAMRNSPDYINYELGVKINAKTPSQESMIFQNNVFNCSATFGKQNNFSDIIRAYVNWYRSIGSGELTEMTINQYLNSSLAEVTDKIKFSGTKSGKTVIVIPKGLDIEVDGNPVKTDKKIEFTSSEKEMEFVINNNGYSYIIELVFRK